MSVVCGVLLSLLPGRPGNFTFLPLAIEWLCVSVSTACPAWPDTQPDMGGQTINTKSKLDFKAFIVTFFFMIIYLTLIETPMISPAQAGVLCVMSWPGCPALSVSKRYERLGEEGGGDL